MFVTLASSISEAYEGLRPSCKMAIRAAEWRKLPVTLSELCIDTTLRCGQSFRWRKSADDEWSFPPLSLLRLNLLTAHRSCALRGRIISLRQEPTHLLYRAIWPVPKPDPLTPPPSTKIDALSGAGIKAEDDTEALLLHYFNLTPNLTQLYEQWSLADANFKKRAPRFAGVRILRQEPWEALVGFICSSNNNIARISQMVCRNNRSQL